MSAGLDPSSKPLHPEPLIPPAKRIRTLIVDDHREAIQAISRFMETQTRVEVVGTAEDGEQGLALIERLQPDLVLLDLLMPKMSGVDVAVAARKRFPSTRIIMMTVLETMTAKDIAKSKGCDGFVTKAHLCTQLPREMARVFPSFGRDVILLVDDEDAVREMLRQHLARLPYVILEASGGSEALEVAERFPGDIKLLLTDVAMPGMNGRELAGRLLRSRPDTQVLYMSGGTDDPILLNRVLKGEAQLLKKPFSISVLTEKLQEMMASKAE
jgi:CheY-like chemotaxis protein